MAVRRSNIQNIGEYLALRLFEMIVHMFDVRASYVTMRLLGDAVWFFTKRHPRRAIEHLRRSFPDWPERKVRRVARQSIRSTALLLLEMLYTRRQLSRMTWRRHVRLHNMQETVRLLVERKKGVVLVTGHFGNFEVITYMMATIGIPTYSVARRLDNPLLDEHLIASREKTGQVIISKSGATAEAPRLLEEKQAVGFVADQDAGRKGIFVDYFGRPASTYKSFGLLAMEYDVPVVIGYGRRLGERYAFEVGVERVIHPQEWKGRDDPLRWLTQEYTHSLENVVRRWPEQYFWAHRRWKHRPKGEPPAEDGIA